MNNALRLQHIYGFSRSVASQNVTDSLGFPMQNYTITGNIKQSRLPSGYTELEYIQSSGTQYIDTGIILDGETTVDLDYMYLTDNQDKSLFGVWYNNSPKQIWQITSYNNSYYFGINSASETNVGTTDLDVRHTIKAIASNGTYSLTLDGTVLKSGADASATVSSMSCYLFCRNASASSGPQCKMSGKIYSFKITKSSTVVLNFIPAKNSSNVIGMYDLVSNTFFTNAGTGTFTAGPAAPTPNAPIDVQGVGDKTENLCNENISAWQSASPYTTYRWQKFTDIDEECYIYLFDRDTSINISGCNFGITNEPKQSGATFEWLVNGGTISKRGRLNIKNNIYMKYMFCYPNTEQTLQKILSRFKIMLVKGSTAPTEYIPYGYKVPIAVNGTTMVTNYLSAPLYKLGTYGDVASYSGQNVSANCLVYIFDGTEPIKTPAPNVWGYQINNSGGYVTGFKPAMSTHFAYKQKTSSSLEYGECSCYCYSTEDIRFFFHYEATTIAQVKSWLAAQYANGTPVIAIFPLATATTRSETLSNIPIVRNDNIVTFATEVQPSAVNYKYRSRTI